jgi:hypothetical protein
MWKAKTLLILLTLAVIFPLAAKANTYVKIADEWGTIQAAGPRNTINGNRFWNIEGDGNTGFGDSGTLRFYTTDLISKLNTDFGAGNWKIDNMTLVFQHSDAAFSFPGSVSVFSFTNDTLPITNGIDSIPATPAGAPADNPPGNFAALPVSSLVYDDTATAGGQKVRVKNNDGSPADLGTVTPMGSYMFNSTGATQTGKLDVIGTTGSLVNPTGAVGTAPNYSLNLPTVAGDSPAALAAAAATGSWSAGAVATMSANLQGGANALSFIFTSTDDLSKVAATYKGNSLVPTVVGDYNNNGIVDAADYTIWRDNLGSTTFTLPNRATANTGAISVTDYTTWVSQFNKVPALPQFTPRIYFQASAINAGGSGSLSGSVVPEPASIVMLVIGVATFLVGRRRHG